MTAQGAKNVLVLCTGNSARSIMAEAILNAFGEGRVLGYSAGSHPGGTVNPAALQQLQAAGLPTERLRSKSWDEFSAKGAPTMDIVITVCDNAAKESCPLWHGAPVTVHWGIPDPAAVKGSDAEVRRAFATAYDVLRHRLQRLIDLPLAQLDADSLRSQLQEIARAYP
jgi:arsenate reductase